MTPEKLKRVIKLVTAIVTTVVAFLVCFITYTSIKIGVLNKRLDELNQLSASLSQQQTQLEQGIAIRETGSYVEQEAREEYGMAQEGDKIYSEN